jgi:hypothetical protein
MYIASGCGSNNSSCSLSYTVALVLVIVRAVYNSTGDSVQPQHKCIATAYSATASGTANWWNSSIHKSFLSALLSKLLLILL